VIKLGKPFGPDTRRMLARISTLLVSILSGMTQLHGQDQPRSADPGGPIATDRPAVANSSVVVPAGSLQLENGFLETRGKGQTVLDGPESLIRFGAATRTELRFTLPDYFHNLTASGGSGFGDFAIGVKQQLGPTPGKFDVVVNSVPQLSDRGHYRFQRRVRSGIAGGMVARGVHKLDGDRNVFGVLAHSRPRAKRDWRIDVPVRSSIDETLGRLCRIRGRLSRKWWTAALAAFRDRSEDHQAATD
jgi:hypothetical protein